MAPSGRLFSIFLTLFAGGLLLVGMLSALPAGARIGARTESDLSPMTSQSFQSGTVVINEVAWSGTNASSLDEWIELYNTTDVAVDLTGWTLAAVDGMPSIDLGGVISPGGFFLLERDDDSTVSDIQADQIYTGFLENAGEQLELRDSDGILIDSANSNGGVWPGGSDLPDFFSMERVNPFVPDRDANWGSNNGLIWNGFDADGNPLKGTPKRWNSIAEVADLGIGKTGPAVAPPGSQVTYTLTFINQGGLTATAVLITDSLPPGVSYLRHDSPYSFTQTGDGDLVWSVGELGPAGDPISMTLTGLFSDVITGTVTNTVRIACSTIERDLTDNLAEWTSRVGFPVPSADLEVEKDGPARVIAGALITYSISIRNRGQISAAGTLLTDSLPAGVELVSQNSPFTFSQPLVGLLVWDIGVLPNEAPLITWTLTGRVLDGVSGWLTNVITAASTTPEANVEDNYAGVMTLALYTPTVRLMAVHFYALQGDDEAVQLGNLGSAPAELGDWALTDNEHVVRFPPTVTLEVGESIWVARDATGFRTQFGFGPDFEVDNSDPAVPDLIGSWPTLSNLGDEVVLLDANARVQDALVYMEGNTRQEGWNGPSVEPYHPGALSKEGQILYRKLDQVSGVPIPDSDTAADWAQELGDPLNGRKVRYPGWDLERFFQTTWLTEVATLTVAVGPDALYSMLAAEIEAAEHSLLIQSYTFENTALAQLVAARAEDGVSVTILLDGAPAGGMTDQERWVCQEIEAAGGRCYFMIEEPGADIYARYTHQHAKYLVIDGKRALIGSENLSLDSMPFDDQRNGTAGQRGVYLITDAEGVVLYLETLFSLDMDPGNHRDIVDSSYIGPPPAAYEPITATDWLSYTALFSVPLTVQGEFVFELVQSPENSLRDEDALLGLLARAGEGDRVLVQQMRETLYWGAGDSNPTDDPNLRLEAYLATARRGAEVQVLLDGYYDDPGDPRGNGAACDFLRDVARQERLQLGCQVGNPTGLGIHNKMVLVQIDGRGYVHVGSLNGSEIASKGNRELALQLQSDAVYLYLAGVFEGDWVYRVYLPLVPLCR